MLRHLLEKWRNWLGDSSLEQAIRKHLASQGYPRLSSQIRDAQMVAIERPGWVQVWRFRVETHRDGVELTLWGAARDDGRVGTKVVLSTDSEVVAQQISLWSDGLIVRRR